MGGGVSFGLTWTHLVSLGLTWTHLDSLGFTQINLDSPLSEPNTALKTCTLVEFSLHGAWSRSVSHGFTWLRLVSPGYTWFPLISLWFHLVTTG